VNVPNAISLARLASVPVIVWLVLNNDIRVAFWVFLAAAVSDAVDGIIAKKFDIETVFGAFLDPLADKALLVGAFVVLGVTGHVETWLVIMVVFRDLVIVGGALLFHTVTQSLTMTPMLISKVNTFMQLLLAGVVLGLDGYGLDQGDLRMFLSWVVAATTLWSGMVYVVKWSQRAAAMEETGDPGRGEEP